MVKTDLTEEKKETIIEALNNNTEPSFGADDETFPGLF